MNSDVESIIQKESEFKRKMVSGYILLNWAQKAIFNAHGAILIEKYCDDCVKQMKFAHG